MKIIFLISFYSICLLISSCAKEQLNGGNELPQVIVTPHIQVNSKVLFWTNDPYPDNWGYGIVPVEVTIKNETKTLWSYYESPGATGPLSCSTNGTLRFDLAPGNYSWTAWQPGYDKRTAGSFVITANQCLTQQIIF